MDIVVREGSRTQGVSAREGATLLEALREGGVHVDAPCGGNGTCGKCRVLVRGDAGLDYRLACETPVEPGMEVVVERSRPMEVSTAGALAGTWPADGASGAFADAAEALTGAGLAVDVGTTTLVCRVVDLATGDVLAARGRSNPQIAFGADVISRISAVADGNLSAMESVLREALADMTDEVLRDAGLARKDVRRSVLAGNTTMQTLAAGLDPTPIGVMPFEPPTLFGDERPYAPLGESAYFAPCVAAYVGGDITCGMLAANMGASPAPVLLLDLGTNGEMALGDATDMVACATAAGPVFEGANIKYGMPAYPGAISQVRYQDGRLDVTVIGGGEPVGLCGTGLIDAVAMLLEQGVLEESGYLPDADEVDSPLAAYLDRDEDGTVFRLTPAVCITQKDVRALQLAKAAVCAGVRTMLDDRGIAVEEVSSLLIAGGFGEYLDLPNAARVGLFPAELLPVARSVGNSAVEGATAALVSARAKTELERLSRECRYIELSLHKKFNEYYVEAMMFEE
ncbi:MAG: DUF4445 domain-containing protein [Eggerthellaceae bacterium]|nr:DUF4445 domain-containing protein [Eggerthellaceae bacterium]